MRSESLRQSCCCVTCRIDSKEGHDWKPYSLAILKGEEVVRGGGGDGGGVRWRRWCEVEELV